MQFVARNYSGLLAPGGLLVIEDVQDPDWVPHVIRAFPEGLRHLASVVDRRHVKGRYDDLLIVLDLSVA